MARPRKPAELKRLSGSRSNMRDAAREPVVTGVLRDPPAPLPPLAEQYWYRKIEQCHWLRPPDGEILLQWCVAAAMYEEALRQVMKDGPYARKNGWTKTTKFKNGKVSTTEFHGVLMRSPAEELMFRCHQIMDKTGSQLGFGPVARTRIIDTTQPPQGGKDGSKNPGRSGNPFDEL